jgi:hypothetical protein
MLAVIIPTVWLTIAMFVVMLCRMAARSDASAIGARLVGQHASAAPATITSLSRRPQRELAGACRARPTRRSYSPQRASHCGRQRA